jgi:hypothetical protein
MEGVPLHYYHSTLINLFLHFSLYTHSCNDNMFMQNFRPLVQFETCSGIAFLLSFLHIVSNKQKYDLCLLPL